MQRGMTWMQEAVLKAKAAPKLATKAVAAQVKIEELRGAIKRIETRQQKWRRLHPEKYKASQAALMKRKRERERAGRSGS